jgi:hypothetical protein
MQPASICGAPPIHGGNPAQKLNVRSYPSFGEEELRRERASRFHDLMFLASLAIQPPPTPCRKAPARNRAAIRQKNRTLADTPSTGQSLSSRHRCVAARAADAQQSLPDKEADHELSAMQWPDGGGTICRHGRSVRHSLDAGLALHELRGCPGSQNLSAPSRPEYRERSAGQRGRAEESQKIAEWHARQRLTRPQPRSVLTDKYPAGKKSLWRLEGAVRSVEACMCFGCDGTRWTGS